MIRIDMLKSELKETQKMLYENLFRLDKIKMLIKSGEQISKKQILKLIDGDLYEKNE